MMEGYKNTELGLIPESWEIRMLKEVSSIVTGNTPPTKKIHLYGSKYPWVTPSDIKGQRKIRSTSKMLSDEGYNKSRQLPKNSLLITCIASIGKNVLLEKEGSCNQQINAILPTEEHSNEFLYYLLDNESKRLINLSGKTAVQIINKSTFETFKVPLPPLPEQQKIAEILTTVDDKIEVIDQQIEQTQELKKGLMQKLLTGEYKIEGGKIVKRNEAFKDTELGKIPESWEVKIIGEFAKVTAGGTPSTQISEYWNGDIRWMNSGEINHKRVKEVESRITKEGLENSSTKLLPKNCVLIALAGQGKTRGTVAINEVELCTNQSLASILPNSEFYPEYLYYNLDSRYIELRRMSTGEGGRGGLNLTIIRGIPVQLPTIEEQKDISEYLNLLDNKTQVLESKKSEYTELKKGLMQKLLTGKIRVKV